MATAFLLGTVPAICLAGRVGLILAGQRQKHAWPIGVDMLV